MSNPPNDGSSRGADHPEMWQSSGSSTDAEEPSSHSPSQASCSLSHSSSSSLDSSSSTPNADAKKLLQLTWTDALGTIISDVEPEPEPVCTSKGKPILAIEYSDQFAYVVGLYRAMRPAAMALVRAPHAQVRAACYGAAGIGSAAMARWLLLTAFTIRQCSSHYTAWSDRRELVLNPHVFWASGRERLSISPFLLPQGVTIDPQTVKTLEDSYNMVVFHFREVTNTWLPSARDLPADAADIISGAATAPSRYEEARLTTKALWHGIRWELERCGSIGRMYHKNFQVWHHRKEMLTYALEKMVDVRLLQQGKSEAAVRDKATRDAALADMTATEQAFDKELQTQYGISFAQIDERLICAEVIEGIDSKNYHVWTHRGGFVHTFSFLVEGTPKAHWRRDWLGFCGDHEVDCETAFVVDKDWLDQNSCFGSAPVPHNAAIAREFNFTAKVINVDCFNNSAWCHRIYLLAVDVVAGLLRQYAAAAGLSPGPDAAPNTEEEHLTLPELLRVLKFTCKKEIDFAMQWACCHPSNECAYVYARAVAELYQSAALRLKLHAAMLTHEQVMGSDAVPVGASDDILHLLTRELRSPVAAACTGFTNNSEHDEDVARYLLNASRYLDWSTYLDTFSLLQYQQDVMHSNIVPLVNELTEQTDSTLRQLAAMADATSDAEELEEMRRRKLNGMYSSTTQFMLDNLHQVHSAMFHSCVAFLEQTWLLYWRNEKRLEVAAARTPEDYARAGVTDEMLPPEAWARNVASARSLSETDMFLEKEAMALSLAKKLTMEDVVRVKYWRHEVRRVMQREY